MAIKSKKKHEKSIRGLFLKYLATILLSLVLVVLLGVGIFVIAVQHIMLLPADTYANIVSEYKQVIECGEELQLSDIPSEIPYAIFDHYGNLEATTLSDGQLKAVQKLLAEKQTETLSVDGNLQKQMQFVYGPDKTYVFEYYITAEFASPALRKLFPHVEWGFVLVLVILLVADIFLVSWLFTRQLGKRIDCLKETADQIRKRELDFEVPETGIREFDGVLASLDDLRSNLNTSLREQWQLQQQKKQQMSALAHDIKTPLTVIRGNTELLQETELTEEQQEYVDYISQNMKRIQEYVCLLIEISKGNQATLQLQDTKLDAYGKDVEVEIRPLLKSKNLQLQWTYEAGTAVLKMDKELMNRALLNLVDNAVQYSPENGTIYFDIRREAEEISISIEDEGRGFSAEDLQNATTEFYRANTNRGMDGHYGMGLYIANQIVMLHGGSLYLSNGIHGAKVTLRLAEVVPTR